MKCKILLSIAIVKLFSLASCETESYTDKKISEVEDSSINKKTLEKNINFDKILSFLNVNSIDEIEIKEYKYGGSINTKGEDETKSYLTLTTNKNHVKSTLSEKYIVLEFNPKNKDTKLVSTIKKSPSKGIISIHQFNNKEKHIGRVSIEYDLEKEIAKFTLNDFDAKGCWNKCVRMKLQEIEDSNWVEKAAFIAGIPTSVLALYASCGVECT
ncbi:MAG: hypothetical protein R6U04_04625 [Bacteroidales bacterium]